MTISQKRFERVLKGLNDIVDMRDELWDRCRVLLQKRFEIEAYILLLATWNSARFRYFMKSFDLDKFRITLRKAEPIFSKLRNESFENADFGDFSLQKKIKQIYGILKEQAEQTGATKIMALKNPKLFVMWDTKLRKMYGIDNKASEDDYINFLIKMKEKFRHIKWHNKKRSLAKDIDGYNYVLAHEKGTSAKT